MKGQGFPGEFAYLNIYPRYALKGSNVPQEIAAQLGTQDYRTYIDRYVLAVNTPYICFDYYLYSADQPGLYESMTVVADACCEHGREMWTVLQVNSHLPEAVVSADQLRFRRAVRWRLVPAQSSGHVTAPDGGTIMCWTGKEIRCRSMIS